MKQTLTSLTLILLLGLWTVSPLSLASPRVARTLNRATRQAAADGIQSAQPEDRGWPRGYSLPSEAQVVIYQPQVASWENQKHLVALSAVSHLAKDAKKPELGT